MTIKITAEESYRRAILWRHNQAINNKVIIISLIALIRDDFFFFFFLLFFFLVGYVEVRAILNFFNPIEILKALPTSTTSFFRLVLSDFK